MPRSHFHVKPSRYAVVTPLRKAASYEQRNAVVTPLRKAASYAYEQRKTNLGSSP